MSTTPAPTTDPLDEDVPPAGFDIANAQPGQRVTVTDAGPGTVVAVERYTVVVFVERYGMEMRLDPCCLTPLVEDCCPDGERNVCCYTETFAPTTAEGDAELARWLATGDCRVAAEAAG